MDKQFSIRAATIGDAPLIWQLIRDLAEYERAPNDAGARMEWAVLDWNEPAIQFDRKLGAKPMDAWTVSRLTSEAMAELAKS